MDLKKVFLDNRYARVSDVIGEGSDFLTKRKSDGTSLNDVSPSDLVEKRPVIRASYVKSKGEHLQTLCDAMIRRMGSKDDEDVPKVSEIYQAIRKGGIKFQCAESLIRIDHINSELEEGDVCRRTNFYESIRHLGAHFFSARPSKMQSFDTMNFRATYSIFSALGEDECLGLGSGSYSFEANVEILRAISNTEQRKETLWCDSDIGRKRYFNVKCLDVISETSIKIEDLLTAMSLPRDGSTIDTEALVHLRRYLLMKPTGCLVVRFLVLYLVLLRMWHAKQTKVELSIPVERVLVEEFNAKGISNCLKISSNDTVVNVVAMDKKEQFILARSVMGYAFGDLPIVDFDFYLGGFDVPKEVKTGGKVYLLGGSRDLPAKMSVTNEDIYQTMVKYAMKMQACDEMELGFDLAGNLIFADGLPNFSVPRPQGFVDIIASALSSLNSDGYVPPYDINDLTMLGFFVVSRQQILMVHDMITYAETPDVDEPIPVLRLPQETRQALYKKYKDERFSDAFSISSITDPLLITNQNQVDRIKNMPFPSLAWSSINNDRLIKSTLSEYFWRGNWLDPEYWEYADASTRKKVVATYYANGFLTRPVVMGVRVQEISGFEAPVRTIRIPAGKVSTQLVDIDCSQYSNPTVQGTYKPVYLNKPTYVSDEGDVSIIIAQIDEPTSYGKLDDSEAMVYHQAAGGEVGMYTAKVKRAKDKVSPIYTIDPVAWLKKKSEDKDTSTTGLVGEVKDLLDATKSDMSISVSNTELRLPKSRSRFINTTDMSKAIHGFGEYINRKHCKAVSIMDRFQHLILRLCPDGVGITCALREELGLHGISRDNIRKWQLVSQLLMPYVPQLHTEGVVGLDRMSKLLAFGMNVKHFGYAKKRFNLKVIPSLDMTKPLYYAWIGFLMQTGITVTYQNTELDCVGVIKSDDPVEPQFHELIELTSNLKYPGLKRLLQTWDYEGIKHSALSPMTEMEYNEMLSIFQTECLVCNC